MEQHDCGPTGGGDDLRFFMHFYLRISKIIRTFAADFKIRTNMKKLFLITMCAGMFIFTGCEQQKQVPPQDQIELSFEYREVEDTTYNLYKIDFRNTSTPNNILQGDMWYRFGDATGGADAIGDGHYRFANIGAYAFRMEYKPALMPKPDDVYAWRKMEVTITGVIDSIWRPATPISPTQIP